MSNTLTRFVLLSIVLLNGCATSNSPDSAKPTDQSKWVKDEMDLDNSALIYLSKEFSQKSGQFKAEPESMLDKEDNIKGDFLVGTYRYVYNEPSEEQGIMVDEMESTELLDCERRYYGTLKQVKKLKGKIVAEKIRADEDISMMQTSGVNLDSKLCELHAGKPVTKFARDGIDNPSYNPNPTAKDIDAIIDKYSQPGAGKTK